MKFSNLKHYYLDNVKASGTQLLPEEMAAPMMKLIVKWSGKEYEISDLLSTDTVKDLKDVIKLKTGVLPERQKLLGLKLKGWLGLVWEWFYFLSSNFYFYSRPNTTVTLTLHYSNKLGYV